ncbi:MAG TPA: VWA domain-containing protein [Candidatus Limnocylindrales bacterium]
MTFIWPQMLLAVVLVPIGIGLSLFIDGRRRGRLAAYGGLTKAQGETKVGRIRSRVPAVMVIAGLVLMAVAMARPQAVVPLPKSEGTVILAFDISASMAATDMAPTRMEAAKVAAKDFVDRQPASVTVGVVAFSDSGVSVQAPTSEKDAVLAAIDRLAPAKGTSVAKGIQASLDAISVAEAGYASNDFYTTATAAPSVAPTPTPTPVPSGTHASAVIVLLSDGENNENPDPATVAQAAANLGVRIYTVGIGSSAGTTVTVDGFQEFTQLDAPTLQNISSVTGGTYYGATDAQQLLSIYDNLNAQFVIRPQLTEITSILAGLGLLFLLAGALSSFVWLGRLP